MNAVIYLDVPDWQIGQDVSIYFPDTMVKHCKCELMKEQEAKPPAIMQDIEGIWSTCSMCGHKLRPILAMKMDTYFPKFCSECGQAVKWDE